MNANFRQRVEERLRAVGMTQRQLAEKLDVSEVTVSRWLSGERNPTVETLELMASVLGTTPSYFLTPVKAEEPVKDKNDSGQVNWGAILGGAALTATAVIAIVAMAKAAGKIDDKDKQQIEDILSREN